MKDDTISRQAAIDAAKHAWAKGLEPSQYIEIIPPAQPEYEPVKAEDFAKTMSENTLYGFMAWHGEALELMERQGFAICKMRHEDGGGKMSRSIDGGALVMWLNDWWASSFGQEETPESKAIHEVLDKVAEYVEKAED